MIDFWWLFGCVVGAGSILALLFFGEYCNCGVGGWKIVIKDIEFEAHSVSGVIMTNRDIAIYKWGNANFDLGVNTIEDALACYEEFKGRKLYQLEIDVITLGFNKGGT